MEEQKRNHIDGSQCEFFRTKGNNTLVARSDTIIIDEEGEGGRGRGRGIKNSPACHSRPP